MKENKEKERKHTLDQESDQENHQEKKKVFRFEDINQFYFQPLLIVSVICRFGQI